jgi:hypothetical protein
MDQYRFTQFRISHTHPVQHIGILKYTLKRRSIHHVVSRVLRYQRVCLRREGSLCRSRWVLQISGPLNGASRKRWGRATRQFCYHDTKYMACTDGVLVNRLLARPDMPGHYQCIELTCFQSDASQGLARCTYLEHFETRIPLRSRFVQVQTDDHGCCKLLVKSDVGEHPFALVQASLWL